MRMRSPATRAAGLVPRVAGAPCTAVPGGALVDASGFSGVPEPVRGVEPVCSLAK